MRTCTPSTTQDLTFILDLIVAASAAKWEEEALKGLSWRWRMLHAWRGRAPKLGLNWRRIGTAHGDEPTLDPGALLLTLSAPPGCSRLLLVCAVQPLCTDLEPAERCAPPQAGVLHWINGILWRHGNSRSFILVFAICMDTDPESPGRLLSLEFSSHRVSNSSRVRAGRRHPSVHRAWPGL